MGKGGGGQGKFYFDRNITVYYLRDNSHKYYAMAGQCNFMAADISCYLELQKSYIILTPSSLSHTLYKLFVLQPFPYYLVDIWVATECQVSSHNCFLTYFFHMYLFIFYSFVFFGAWAAHSRGTLEPGTNLSHYWENQHCLALLCVCW